MHLKWKINMLNCKDKTYENLTMRIYIILHISVMRTG